MKKEMESREARPRINSWRELLFGHETEMKARKGEAEAEIHERMELICDLSIVWFGNLFWGGIHKE